MPRTTRLWWLLASVRLLIRCRYYTCSGTNSNEMPVASSVHQSDSDKSLNPFTPDSAKSKIDTFSNITSCVKLKKQVLLNSFPMNGHPLGFCPYNPAKLHTRSQRAGWTDRLSWTQPKVDVSLYPHHYHCTWSSLLISPRMLKRVSCAKSVTAVIGPNAPVLTVVMSHDFHPAYQWRDCVLYAPPDNTWITQAREKWMKDMIIAVVKEFEELARERIRLHMIICR